MVWQKMTRLAGLMLLVVLSACGGQQPKSFTFETKQNVALGIYVESNAIKLMENYYGSTITIENGEYAVSSDGGTTYSSWTSSPGKVTAFQYLKVRHKSATTISTSTVTTVRVHEYTTTFTSITTGDATAIPPVFNNNSSSTQTTTPITRDASGLIQLVSLTAAESFRNASEVTFSVTIEVKNTDTVRANIEVQYAGVDANGAVIHTGTMNAGIDPGQTYKSTTSTTTKLTITEWENITSWIATKIIKY